MNSNNALRIVSIGMIIFPLLWITLRLVVSQEFTINFAPEKKFIVGYEFTLEGKKDFEVKSFLPVQNQRQQIYYLHNKNVWPARIYIEGANKVVQWTGTTRGVSEVRHYFEYVGKPVVYEIDPEIRYEPVLNTSRGPYLSPTELIQSDTARIIDLARQLAGHSTTLVEILHNFYDFVLNIPSSATSELTDALTALNRNEASCNGKSRLFVALCRSMNIPARMSGGIILETTRKKTSHAWAEVLVRDIWVPFDALNGHFASLPANYLEIYKGDEFLIKRSPGLAFDYIYDIQEEQADQYPKYALLDIWSLMKEASLPVQLLKVLLLLPLGAVLVAILKTVVGLKSFGVFLPVLLALALLETGIIAGLVLCSAIVLTVALINYPLERLGIQHTSKTSVMLIMVVIVSLIAIKILVASQWINAASLLFFPVIILTIMAEKFARKAAEESISAAWSLYLQTLIATVFIYWIISSALIQHFMLTFPEFIVSLVGINLLLGKWIGLRLMEYTRFYGVLNA